MNKSLLIAEIATSDEVGKLGLMHLKRYWSKLYLSTNKRCMIPEEPGLDNALLSAAGIGIYQVSKYFYEKRPSFAQFEDWVLALNDGQLDKERTNRFNSLFSGSADMKRNGPHLYTLSSEDLRFWDENGYLIVRNAVPKEDCKAAVDAICEFLQIDLEDENTWYLAHKSLQGIMVQLFQHPVLQRNRGSEKVKAVYEQLWNRSDLWVNTDKVGFNPPENDHYKFRGTGLHWDVSLEQPIPFGTQGILYLTDTSSD
ncbi:MAG: phytanoyl-CoA dioxygenase, partial [Pedobacter sp.]